MSPPRIFSEIALGPGPGFALPPAAAGHVARVLRLGAGDPITLFDGSGMDFPARIVAAGKRGVTVDVGPGVTVGTESPLAITLLQGIGRGPRMDLVLQKATELGVAAIRPLLTSRTVVRLDEERAAQRRQHWQRILVSAAEQCGRSTLPVLHAPASLADALAAEAGKPWRFFLDPAATPGLPAGIAGARAAAVLVGPEGGLSPHERALATASGFRGLRLGPRILRTETAPLAALSILQFLAGDLGAGPGKEPA
jgi:16S rRNA (uracil1498-N3)-methyltransferase